MARQRQFTAEQQAERHADQQATYRARQARLRDIGPLPPVEDPARHEQAEDSLLFFLSNYFPGTFGLEWSPDHLEVIEQTERVIRDGSQMALAMPRGNGKSRSHSLNGKFPAMSRLRHQCRSRSGLTGVYAGPEVAHPRS